MKLSKGAGSWAQDIFSSIMGFVPSFIRFYTSFKCFLCFYLHAMRSFDPFCRVTNTRIDSSYATFILYLFINLAQQTSRLWFLQVKQFRIKIFRPYAWFSENDVCIEMTALKIYTWTFMKRCLHSKGVLCQLNYWTKNSLKLEVNILTMLWIYRI